MSVVIRFMQFPSCDMDCWCASLVVSEFTEFQKEPSFFFILKDRSSMHLKSLLLCGTIATGDNLKFAGTLSLMSDHLTTRAYPFLIFSVVSRRRNSDAPSRYADLCGPRSKAS